MCIVPHEEIQSHWHWVVMMMMMMMMMMILLLLLLLLLLMIGRRKKKGRRMEQCGKNPVHFHLMLRYFCNKIICNFVYVDSSMAPLIATFREFVLPFIAIEIRWGTQNGINPPISVASIARNIDTSIKFKKKRKTFSLLLEASLAFGYCRCLYLCVCLCVCLNPSLSAP